MSNYSRKLPRAELKAEAKKMLRPNWATVLLVTLIYMILMGLASGLCSMVGYDKLKQCIEQISGNKK